MKFWEIHLMRDIPEAGGDIDLLERYRMKDSPAPGDPPQRISVPWS